MTLGFPTVLIPALQEKPDEEKTEGFYLNKAQISWISSINLIFVPLGCIFSGSFTAFLGRRRAMQLVCLPILAAWIIFYFSHHVNHLYAALCLSGFTGEKNADSKKLCLMWASFNDTTIGKLLLYPRFIHKSN